MLSMIRRCESLEWHVISTYMLTIFVKYRIIQNPFLSYVSISSSLYSFSLFLLTIFFPSLCFIPFYVLTLMF